MQEAKAELQTAAAKLARAEAALEAWQSRVAQVSDKIVQRTDELLATKSEQEKKDLREVIDGLERQQGVLRAERDAALARRDALEAQFRGECVVVAW